MSGTDRLDEYLGQRLQWNMQTHSSSLHAAAPGPTSDSTVSAETRPSLRPLLGCSEAAFPHESVVVLFGRAPCVDVLLRVAERRASGESRASILRDLLREAAAEGLQPPRDWEAVLPRSIDVGPLLATAAQGREFVVRAYELLLNRTPAEPEIAQALHAIRRKDPSDLLIGLAESREAELQGGEITLIGLQRRSRSLGRYLDLFARPKKAEPRIPSRLTNTSTADDHISRIVRTAVAEQTEPRFAAIESSIHLLSETMATLATTADRMRTRLEVEGGKSSEISGYARESTECAREAVKAVQEASASLRVMVQAAMEVVTELSSATERLRGTILDEATQSRAALNQIAAVTTANSGALQEFASGITSATDRLQAHSNEALQCLESRMADLIGRSSTLEAAISGIRPPVVPAGDIVVVTVDDFFLGIPAAEWRLSTYYHQRGPLEPGVYEVLRRFVRPGMLVADVGANVGLYTLLSARLLQGEGHVFSFEPTPSIFELLVENVRLNGFLETGIVQMYNLAVGEGDAEVTLYSDRRDSTHNSLFPEPGQTDTVTVRCKNLDTLLGPGARLDFVKVDAEGAEALVYRGMQTILGNSPNLHMVLEFAPGHLRRAGIEPAEFLNQIARSGMLVSRIDDLSGDLLIASHSELLSRENSNVFLRRP